MRGYRGLFREFASTGSWRALVLQVRTGVVHVARQWTGRRAEGDPLERFFASYGADGVRPAPERETVLRLEAQACLVCGLCDVACAEAGGSPLLAPRDAVVAASRLQIDWQRLGLDGRVSSACEGCRACEPSCPRTIPIARIQDVLAGAEGRGGGPPSG